tara:strand:- start:1451 stop:1675 length:225 start_codon:yes stop_codon:yes gene_type:complete
LSTGTVDCFSAANRCATADCSSVCGHTADWYCVLPPPPPASEKKVRISCSYEITLGSNSTLMASVWPSLRQTVL